MQLPSLDDTATSDLISKQVSPAGPWVALVHANVKPWWHRTHWNKAKSADSEAWRGMGNEGGLPNLSVNLRDKQSLFKSLLWDKKSKLNLKLSKEQLVVCPSNFTLAVVHFSSALGHEKTFSPCSEYHDATTHVDRKVRIPPKEKLPTVAFITELHKTVGQTLIGLI